MTTMDVETEIRDLKRRVGELEGSFGFLIEQVKAVHRDLIAFQAQTTERFDKLEAGQKRSATEISGLRRDLPDIIANAVTGAMRDS